MKYDAVIVGASLAGLHSGLKLAQSGMNICIIDRRHEIGIPMRCGEATGNRKELERFFKVDPSWIACDIKGLAAYVNESYSVKRAIPDAGVMLHRDKLEQDFAKIATKHGASIMLDTMVTGLHRDNKNRVDGVHLEGGEVVQGEFVIGADGCESKVGQWAGLTKPLSLHEIASTLEYRVESDSYNDQFLHFFMGSATIPPGYIWVFPKGKGQLLIGGCIYGSLKNVEKVKHFVDSFTTLHFPGAVKHSMITGGIPVTISPRQLTKENVVLIGDSARQVNPLTAGGIMNTFEAADMATNCILKCKGDYRILNRYSDKWCSNQRRQQKLFRLFRDIVVNSSDNDLIRMVQITRKAFDDTPDRSKPFKLPAISLLILGLSMLPKVYKYRNALRG